MLKLILHLSKVFFREPCSVQREILTRLQKKRGVWDADNGELLEIYEYINTLIKKRTRAGTITPKELMTLAKHPTSALNFLSGRKVPLNDLERFRLEFVKGKS